MMHCKDRDIILGFEITRMVSLCFKQFQGIKIVDAKTFIDKIKKKD